MDIDQEIQLIHEINSLSSALLDSTFFPILDEYRELYSDTQDENDESFRSISAINTSHVNTLTPEALAKLWHIGIKTARRTLKATSHTCIRSVGNLTRRFRTDRAHMRYKKLSTRHDLFYVDTLLSKIESIRGFACGNLYTNNLGFRKFFPMEFERHTPNNLQSFIKLVGLPPRIHSDNAKVFVHGEFGSNCAKHGIQQSFTEPHSPWQNRAETGIRGVKTFGRKIMEEEQAPIRLWCFAYEYAAELQCLMATGIFDLEGRTPYEHIMQYTPDISEYVVFRWYQWSYYWNEITKEKDLC